MISCSHWGMFAVPVFPRLLPAGFKLAPEQEAELKRPDGIVRIEPLARGEPQPVYVFAPEKDGT